MKHHIRKYIQPMVYAVLYCFCIALNANAHSINPNILHQLRALEKSTDGKIGVSAFDTASGKYIRYHANERFPMCSTHKLMVVSAILNKSKNHIAYLQHRIIYKKRNLVTYSPATVKHLSDGMTIANLCAAAITLSDNTATNLLIKELGGFKGVNIFARSIGDNTFRLDRLEPELNSALFGDIRDTTTPAAMQNSLYQLALGAALPKFQQLLLQHWLKTNTTGNARIQAGVPNDWAVADKSGTGAYGTTNDVGIIWPPNSTPIVVAIYFRQYKKDVSPRDDVIASITRMIVSSFMDGK